MSSVESVQSAVAGFLAQFRRQHDLTLEQIAREARRFGAAWGTQSVRNIEIGRAAPTLPTMITLALALHGLTGVQLKLSDLLGAAESVAPPTALDLPFTRDWMNGVLRGDPIVVGGVDRSLDGGASKASALWGAFPDNLKRIVADLPPGMDWETLDQLSKERRPATLAEQRAAARLGLSEQSITLWSAHLWGHSLDDEARARSGPEASPQARGRVTRHLVEELRRHLAAAEEVRDG